MNEAATAARKDHDIDVRFIVGFNRQQFFRLSQVEQSDVAKNVLEVTDKYRQLVVGFDTWGTRIGGRRGLSPGLSGSSGATVIR